VSEALRRWDLILVDLDAGAGSEQRGTRPALVVSNDGFNRHFPLATVLPLTKRAGKRRRVYPFEVLLPAGSAGNDLDSVVMPHQVRTVSLGRVVSRLGSLRATELRAQVEARLLDHLGIGLDE
jgi:mRNA interferase MazF